MGYQPVGPYWNQLNNNQWHRATYLLQPASSPGATDGVARMWVDGTKIVDISAAAAGVTPPGGTKVWCTMAEVAQLDTYQTGPSTWRVHEWPVGGRRHRSADDAGLRRVRVVEAGRPGSLKAPSKNR